MSLRSPARAASVLAAVLMPLLVTGCASGDDSEASAPDPPGVNPQQREVTFDSGPDTLHGTFAMPPEGGDEVPAALIISGSGPTDRNGDNPERPDAGTNANFARVLAEAGVASLRYDKLGSGKTGMASRDADDTIGYDVFENEVADAYAHLADQPGVDPSRLLVLGHSEGALFALRTHEVVEEHPPQALILAAPPGERYLDTLDRQLTEQVRRAEAEGGMSFTESDETLSDARYAISRIRDGDDLAQLDLAQGIDALLAPELVPYLRRIDRFDPVDLARDLPPDTRTLVLWGTTDSQIAQGDVDRLMTGLPEEARRADIDGADHVFRSYDDSPGATGLDSQRRFSPGVAPPLHGFLESAVGTS